MTMEELTERIAAERAAYHQAVDAGDEGPRKLEVRAARIRELNAQLVATITAGANPCPNCGQPPHGMLHHEDAKRPIEIGCLACAGKVYRDDAGAVLPPDRQPSFHVRASSRETAIARWNAGKYDPLRGGVRELVATALGGQAPG